MKDTHIITFFFITVVPLILLNSYWLFLHQCFILSFYRYKFVSRRSSASYVIEVAYSVLSNWLFLDVKSKQTLVGKNQPYILSCLISLFLNHFYDQK